MIHPSCFIVIFFFIVDVFWSDSSCHALTCLTSDYWRFFRSFWKLKIFFRLEGVLTVCTVIKERYVARFYGLRMYGTVLYAYLRMIPEHRFYYTDRYVRYGTCLTFLAHRSVSTDVHLHSSSYVIPNLTYKKRSSFRPRTTNALWFRSKHFEEHRRKTFWNSDWAKSVDIYNTDSSLEISFAKSFVPIYRHNFNQGINCKHHECNKYFAKACE